MLHNKKGAALLQVLLVTVVLAGMATMLLRANLSRTTTSRQTRQAVSRQMLINTCQAEVNALWSLKNADQFAVDLQSCQMYCGTYDENGSCTDLHKSYKCKPVTVEDVTYQVEATFTGATPNNGKCDIEYEIKTVTDSNPADYPTTNPETQNNGNNGNGGGSGNKRSGDRGSGNGFV